MSLSSPEPLTTPSTAPDPVPLVALAQPPIQCPQRLTLPASIDAEGKVWPCAAIQRLQTVYLADLLAAGVQVQWTLPDGTVIDEDTGRLLVGARQADTDQGYKPVFEVAEVTPVNEAPEAKL